MEDLKQDMKEFSTHLADAFAIVFTSVSGYLHFNDIKIFQNFHNSFQEFVFYIGGVFTLLWLFFRMAKSYNEYKKSKK
ncbi:MAG TPA: hypothetical protein PLS10_13670 [Chitinophagales bacterium]|nr:hypothetical protein [Chitinophagales bacterium]